MAKTRTNGSAAAAAEHPGLTFPRTFTKDIPPGCVYDDVEWETRTAAIENTDGESVFRQEGIEGPEGLVPAGDQHRLRQVLPREPGHRGARAQRAPARLPRRRHHHPVGRERRLFRHRRRPRGVPRRSHLPARAPESRVQQPRLVQLRVGRPPAVQCVLHPERRRHNGVDPRAGEDRGHAVQVRLRNREQPVRNPLVARDDRRRRHRVGTGLLHEGLRRLRRRHQVGRRKAQGRQDGDPRRRPSRHPRLHRLQGRGGAQGLGTDRCRLRRVADRSRLRLGLLPEREQQRPGPRRVHARGARRRRVAHARRQRRAPSRRHAPGTGPDAQDRRTRTRVRRPGDAVRHDHQRVAHVPEPRPGSTHPTRAASPATPRCSPRKDESASTRSPRWTRERFRWPSPTTRAPETPCSARSARHGRPEKPTT